MPRGVPVATVAVNNATNAGLLAVRMLGVGDADLVARLDGPLPLGLMTTYAFFLFYFFIFGWIAYVNVVDV